MIKFTPPYRVNTDKIVVMHHPIIRRIGVDAAQFELYHHSTEEGTKGYILHLPTSYGVMINLPKDTTLTLLAIALYARWVNTVLYPQPYVDNSTTAHLDRLQMVE